MVSEIQRMFDPSFEIPEDLEDSFIGTNDDADQDIVDPDADIDTQSETLDDDESELDEEDDADGLDVPGTFEIISQTVRTGPDGSQVIDVVIDVEEVEGALKYEVRITKA